MKKQLLSFIIGGITLLGFTANAATFTAVQSGDWSVGSTWSGGSAPTFNIFADDIIIPSGINVNLDGNLEINGLLAELSVMGNLESNNNSTIMIQQGLLTGQGMIDVDRIEFGGTANSTFSGDFRANTMVSNSYNLLVDGAIFINDSLILRGGQIDLSANDTLWVATDAVIWVRDGGVVGTGSFVAEGNYDVIYEGSSNSSGLELTGQTLNNLTLDLDDNNSAILLTQQTAVNGMLMISQGMLDLDGNNLIIDGDFQQMSNTAIMSDGNSELWIMAESSLSSSIMFSDTDNDIGRIVIDFENGGQASFDSDGRIMTELRIVNGDMAIEAGNDFTLATNAMIWVNEGQLMTNGSATFVNEGNVRLMYTGSEKATGVELMSGAVTDFTLNLTNDDQSLWLMSDLMISDSANSMAGTIALNGNDLRFTGYTSSSSSLRINGDENSMLWIGGDFEEQSMIMFDSDDSLSALVIDLNNTENVWLEGSVNVMDSLNLNSGVLIVNNSNIWVRNQAMVNGGSNDSYIQTEGSARLGIMIQGDNQATVEFPVGDDDGYSPIRIRNAETNDADFTVNLNSVVFMDGTSGYDFANSTPVVNKTWFIEADANADVDLTLEAEWTSAMEVNGFDRTEAYISHYVNGAWDVDATASAQTTTSGSFMLTRSGITSLSPFSVQNEESVTGLNDFATNEMSIYPNPVKQTLFIELGEANVDQVTLFDLSGKQVMTMPVDNMSGIVQLSVADLEQGIYIVQMENEGSSVRSQRVVKL